MDHAPVRTRGHAEDFSDRYRGQSDRIEGDDRGAVIDETPARIDAPTAADRLARLEQRIARLEQHLGLPGYTVDAPAQVATPSTSASRETTPVQAALETGAENAGAVVTPRAGNAADEFEFEVGQDWFARVGIIALAIGGGFMLSLPYADLPASAPALVGFAVAIALFVLAHWGQRAFPLVSRHLRGAGMALQYCATLRLFFFGAQPVLHADTAIGRLVLVAVAALNLLIAWQRRSPWLMLLALVSACATPLAIGDAAWLLPAVVLIAAMVVVISVWAGWPALMPIGAALAFLVYFAWAIGNPFLGGAYHWATQPGYAPVVLLVVTLVFGTVPLWCRRIDPDKLPAAAAAALGCMLGYGVFLLHTSATGTPRFGALQLAAALVFEALAAALWLLRASQLTTFFYAMCGYAAASMAIIKLTTVPSVFVWLSAESVVVVATAIWFRSRFIVVTNFLIYALVVLAYVVLNERETGISLGFGLVALVSARILNWQKHRLALKTELMRNAYLLSAFIVFPYALHHLVPRPLVALSWIGLAVVYYALNFAISNQKYRWMGHATLLLTAVALVIPGQPGFTPAHRVASFLALGAVLLIVSLLFTRSRRRAETATAPRT